MNSTTLETDFCVIGSGAAGLHAALHASEYGSVTVVTKSRLETSSSYWAQGGIAAVLNNDDSFQSHEEDTLAAGRNFCNKSAVDVLVKEGARQVQQLIDKGMPFDRTNGHLDLGLEGGHTNRRVLHANGAATGKALVEFLIERVRKKSNIRILEEAFVYQILTDRERCSGARAYLYQQDQLITIQSPVTILASGGYSGLYSRTTNPHTSTGDGLWLAYNAGAVLRDLEFIQFHPTAFYAEEGSSFLISEALRGEGARLYNQAGERFMGAYPQKELAPRDVVARQILDQIHKQDESYVLLDVSHLDADVLRDHFPNLLQKIANQGIDVTEQGIPVAPAAHYCIGGVATDLNSKTSVNGLYACGEVAANGVHGANRLASNSLLECLVFSKRAVDHAASWGVEKPSMVSPHSFDIDDHFAEQFSDVQQQVSALLTKYIGIERHAEGMRKALQAIRNIQSSLFSDEHEYYGIRARGMLHIAEMIASAALQRQESRGVHQRSDFTSPSNSQAHIEYQKENPQLVS
ncbi:L-aspartate oxidase [Fodinibius salinus]|uniref:L-aspartate oxidase n=1 Tax=Fodinibius salinus TaxID=860790 RepID=UPI00147958C6|nr:L-aspartate oxidase [Fodinibius salinus]